MSNDGDFTTTTLNNSRTSPPVSTTTTSSSDQQQQHQPSRTPLESIAEVTETVTSSAQDTGFDSSDNKPVSKHDLAASVAAASKLDMLVTAGAASGVELKSSGGKKPPTVLLSKQSVEATTSIDLNCDETPTSASILISDHNIKPSDRIASVLHYKEDKQQQQQQQQQSGATTNSGEPRVGVVADEQRSHNNCELNNGIISQQQQGMLATDSLDSEEAAAIRIQSAFRGYRTRKNSPYRTRSPSSSIDATIKRNGICQQPGANILQETTLDDHDIAAAVSNDEQIEAARLLGRRESRQRHRDLSPIQRVIADDHQRTSGLVQDESEVVDKQQQQQQGEHIQAATSIEEFTTTEDTTNTVKEATFEMPNQQQRQTLSETGLETTTETPCQTTAAADQSAVSESVKQQLDEPNNNSESSRKADGLSLSFDIAGGLSEEANTLDETGLSAALEAIQTDDLIENGAGGANLGDNSLAPRPSEASVELDTDSSVLGAALSFNEDFTSAPNNDYSQQLQQHDIVDVNQTGGVSTQQQQQLQDAPIDDDKSQGVSLITDELEFEARRLVDELNREAADNQDDRDEDNDGAIVEDQEDEIDDTEEIILNEEEQRVIEMESDDIERRDPRGQASEERAKSPQIRSSEEEPKFDVTTTEQSASPEIVEGSERPGEATEREKEEVEEEDEEVEEIIGSTGAHLEVQSPNDGRTSSGRSSPAINSSPANSSSESDDNNSEAGTSPTTTTTTPTKQQAQAQGNRQQQNNQQTGKNKRKNRKRKSKK